MRKDIWVFLFALGLLLFSWPLMSIFRNILPAYLFVAWFVFIGFIFTVVAKTGKEEGGR
ncbi:MAG: hypothetical protein ACM34I_03965 [bacterium]